MFSASRHASNNRKFESVGMKTHAMMTVLLAVLLACLLCCEVARVMAAESQPRPVRLLIDSLSASEVTGIALQLMEQGRRDEAQAVLEQLAKDNAGGRERQFLQALLDASDGRLDDAISGLRSILDQDPTLLRVRLELARALFADGEDEAADYHFQLAAADRPGVHVMQAISQYRQAIRHRRAWRFEFETALAPDTNINGATDADHIRLLGLPFKLDEASQRRSGLGVAVNASGSYRFRRDSAMPIYAAVWGHSLRYRDQSFNDESAGIELGPEWKIRWGRLRATGRGALRWLGGNPYETRAGTRLSLETMLPPGWMLLNAVAVEQVVYPDQKHLDGFEASLTSGLSQALGPQTIASAWISLSRKSAGHGGYAFTQGALGMGLSHELALGLRAGAAVGYVRSIYDDALPVFGIRRKDRTWTFEASLMKRDWNVAGFAPQVRVSYGDTQSSVALNESQRWRAELGITRVF